MRSVCVLLPSEHAREVVEARALLCGDPTIGAIYDPPFVHFTIQLAEEYDWAGLDAALSRLVREWQPFPLRTVGLPATDQRCQQ